MAEEKMRNAGMAATKAEMKRGYSVSTEGLDVPPKERSMDEAPSLFDPNMNWERMVWDPETNSYRDRYAGGFLPRDGYSTER